MKVMKKFISLVMSVIVLCSVFVSSGLSASAETTDYSYTVLSDGTIEITGYDGDKTELDIPSAIDGYKVSSIGSSAFDNKMIKSVIIPDTVNNIADSAFATNRLVSVSIPDSVTILGEFVFYNCPYLTDVSIPESITSLSAGLFSGCSSLNNVTIPESVTAISDSAFSSCESLSSITIPESVVSIGYYAFCNCSKLSSITLPKSVSVLGENAFLGCTELESITIENPDCEIFDSIETIPCDATIIGDDGSTAQEYALWYNRTFEPLPLYILGDVDLDKVISVMDATAIQMYLAQFIALDDMQLLCADTDKDGVVSIMDTTEIQMFLAGFIEEL